MNLMKNAKYIEKGNINTRITLLTLYIRVIKYTRIRLLIESVSAKRFINSLRVSTINIISDNSRITERFYIITIVKNISISLGRKGRRTYRCLVIITISSLVTKKAFSIISEASIINIYNRGNLITRIAVKENLYKSRIRLSLIKRG